MGRYLSDRDFENDVRRAADALFELDAGECKPELYTKGNTIREIDGVARCRDIVHLIMATTSPRFEKVREDVVKLQFAAEIETSKGNPVKKWMIVEKHPEAPHVSHARKEGTTLLTFKQFQERFFDGRSYLSKRKNASFGSARDPNSGAVILGDDEFIEPPLFSIGDSEEIDINKIIKLVKDGICVVLLGPFGSGKSLTLREIWFNLRKEYLGATLDYVPVAINLREHWGAEYADEVLRRHARGIGMTPESDLTVAWRAGMLAMLIDGFDEMASQGVTGLGKTQVLRQIRHNALIGIRDLVSKTPPGIGMLITGRDHYFDDYRELQNSLGANNLSIAIVRVDEFDDARAIKYLKRKGIETQLPDWLPRKALLLGYLTRHGMLDDVLSIDGSLGQAKAWHEFLRLICLREAEHDRAAMDPETVQRVLEHLAVQVRSTSSGVGPISASMLALAYSGVTGQIAGDAVLMQLQRLPGLTERDAEPGTRSFVDQDLLETLQGVAIARQLLEGSAGKVQQLRYKLTQMEDSGWLDTIGALGCGVAAIHFKENGWKIESLVGFIRQFSSSQFGADLLQIALSWAIEEGKSIELSGVIMEGVQIGVIDLEEYCISGLTIRDSLLKELILGSYAQDSSIRFENTDISKVIGLASSESLPGTITRHGKCDIGRFDSFSTTDAFVALKIDDRLKALLSSLKKLFRQRGAGRAVGAFRRGLPVRVEPFVEPVLQLLVQEGFAWRIKDVIHPNRRFSRRAHEMLDNPLATDDKLFERVLNI